jgi:hypothetical protein
LNITFPHLEKKEGTEEGNCPPYNKKEVAVEENNYPLLEKRKALKRELVPSYKKRNPLSWERGRGEGKMMNLNCYFPSIGLLLS